MCEAPWLRGNSQLAMNVAEEEVVDEEDDILDSLSAHTGRGAIGGEGRGEGVSS